MYNTVKQWNGFFERSYCDEAMNVPVLEELNYI